MLSHACLGPMDIQILMDDDGGGVVTVLPFGHAGARLDLSLAGLAGFGTSQQLLSPRRDKGSVCEGSTSEREREREREKARLVHLGSDQSRSSLEAWWGERGASHEHEGGKETRKRERGGEGQETEGVRRTFEKEKEG